MSGRFAGDRRVDRVQFNAGRCRVLFSDRQSPR
jgi:hypothetical protein